MDTLAGCDSTELAHETHSGTDKDPASLKARQDMCVDEESDGIPYCHDCGSPKD